MNTGVKPTPETPLTLYGIDPADLMQDIYFQPDFLRLHAAPDPVDTIEAPSFRNGAAIRRIDGTALEDMETPWGYGGPVADSQGQMREGMWLWRQRQREAGRVAEFVRLHPFLNPVAVRDYYDDIRFDRVTVAVDLLARLANPRKDYSTGTKYRVRKAQRELGIVRLGPEHAAAFARCYDAGLDRNNAETNYYLSDDYHRAILSAPWATCWGADYRGEIVSAACFIHGGVFCHYHLSGSTPLGRDKLAHYVILDHALDHFAARGFEIMHLGGGRTGRHDDALLEFKRKFSQWRLAFYTAGAIYDAREYAQRSTGDARRFLNYRFLLPPRAEVGDVVLRVAEPRDVLSFFRLKCDIANIFWSGYTAPPDWRNLHPWFGRQLATGSAREIFMAEMNGHVIGYAYLDDKGAHRESTVGVAASEAGRGVGRRLLSAFVAMLRQRADDRPVEAWIFPSNVASVKAHEAAGYVLDESRGQRAFPMPFIQHGNRQNCWVWRRGG